MESILQRQQEIVEAIKKIERNFGKDPVSRKTRKYLDERLDALDKLWAEFQGNNQRLSLYHNGTDPYFKENQYEQAREYFDSVRMKVASFSPAREISVSPTPETRQPLESPAVPTMPKLQPRLTLPTISNAATTSQTDRGQANELMSLQRTNFRAFHRQVNRLKIDEILDKWELEDELRNLQTRWNAIDALHLQIDNILQGSDTQYDSEFNDYEDSFKSIKKALNLKLTSTIHQQKSTPQIDLPTFTGKYTQWPTFYDLYVESIHHNNLLTKTQKMQHLKSKLRGDAERLIQHLSISAENYDTAWELLTHRYNNPHLLFTKHIEILLNLPAAQKQSAYEIRRIYDTSMECIHAIRNLGIDTSTWDPLLVHIITKKLDTVTYSDYKEARKMPRELPSLSELMDFLESKFIALEPIGTRDRETSSSFKKYNQQKSLNNKTYKPQYQKEPRYGKLINKEFHSVATYMSSCPICDDKHPLYKCAKFIKYTPGERLRIIEDLLYCNNCLCAHNKNLCVSTKKCKVCKGSHNTMLHDAYTMNFNKQSTNTLTDISSGSSTQKNIETPQKYQVSMQQNTKQHSVNHVATDEEEILLTTLSIRVKAFDGTYMTLRCLLDQGSQISLISENAAQMLGLPRQRYHASVSGIGNGSKHSKGIVKLECQSVYQNYAFTTQALVINHVINNLPNISFKKESWPHIQHIQLADPEYNVSRPIDLLLDASIYSEIIMSGLIKGPNMTPIAQQTKLGWILSGSVKTFKCHVITTDLSAISQYWELEEVNDSSIEMTPDEEYCEQFYQSTTKRLSNGRYEVALPMKPGFEQNLGESKTKAIAQFYNLEKRMNKNDCFAESYKFFMKEYEQSSHMAPVTKRNSIVHYLPHHGVQKTDSTTTKLRTVFNGSSKTSSGFSLNDLMERGPNLQKDLQHLILVWRQHKYVVTADIEKMFRQIMIRESDQHLQRIVWRDVQEAPLREYQLTTVTYGTKAAPYLAMRTIKQLAMDDAHKFPLAAKALMTSLYMDDLLEGCDNITQAKQLQGEVIDILKGAGMNIRKWSSNTRELIERLSANQLDTPLDFKGLENRKTLGLRWIPSSDIFVFKNIFENENSDDVITKRQLLSNISRVYDPMGFLSPLSVRSKLLFQRTWSEETTDWDTHLSKSITNEWIKLKHDYQKIDQFKIPRYIGDKNHYTIHGFCDASEKAYACAIYAVTINSKGKFTSTLVTAKTKLAPLKKKLSLPKLELCGALLLSRLIKKVTQTMPENLQVYAWTDSMVVLGWLHGDVNRWKQFVANRVRTIINIIPSSSWHHVKSEDNPADCASRGLSTQQLLEHHLWWQGPQWLLTFDSSTLKEEKYQPPRLEIKASSVTAALSYKNDLILQLLNECSSIERLTTIIGWLTRYTQWLQRKQIPQQNYLSSSERKNAMNLIIKTIQTIEFEDEIERLQKQQGLNKSSKLLSLLPYLDPSDGLLRVGGRLNNSFLSQSAKHPAILPSHGKLTELVIRYAHCTTLHGGPSLTLSYVRENYWVISGLRTVKRELRKCIKCRRFKAEKITQIMADLPEPRVTPSRTFYHCGVDFTGSFDIKSNKGRGIRTQKGYVAVFVCLSTKAVHLELVSDISTPGFLAAFRRFCARRCTPKHMYSDQGRNFIGASKELKKEYNILVAINTDVMNKVHEYDIQWHFNAPAYPSAGGLWEAAVKSFKHHLRRVIGEQKLTYEEFTTLLYQIEACLNSRPLVALTENPEDEYLTPGHFLVGGSLIARPQTDPNHMDLRTRWQTIQAMNKQFWKRWSSDYLQQLQVRTKWRTPSKNIEVDDIVLIKDENLSPGKWSMGRVVKVHPGKDGYVRVVSVRTKNGVIQRPILKLSVLPVREESTETQAQTRIDNIQKTCDDVTRADSKPRCRQIRKPVGTFFTMLLMLILFLFKPTECSYNITTLNSNQKIYFDKMYDVHIIRDEWKLIAYYNMSTYWSALRHVKNYVSHLEESYLSSDLLPTQYKSIIYQLQHEISEIEHYNTIFKKHIYRRQKRGLINGVGYVANSLFGVLDERFAKKYEKDIEKISVNENHLRLLLKNQTSVIEAQYNILQRNEEIMNKQFGIIQQYLKNSTSVTNRIEKVTNNELQILSSSVSVMIIISNLQHLQETVINTLTSLANGHLDAHLLPPEQLEEQSNIIYRHIPNDLTLPADKNDLKELYKLMKVNGDIGSSYLIIEIKIPLVIKENFELDRVITLPQQHYNIEFIAPYIAFNLQKDLLLVLTDSDVESCVHIQTNKLLCALDKPIYELPLTSGICNLSIHNTTICKTKESPCRVRWVKLHNNNMWLYSCCGKCTVRIFCVDTGVIMTTLTGNGLLQIGQGCTIKSDMFSIFSQNSYMNQVKVQENIAIPTDYSILNSIINTSDFQPFTPEDHEDLWHRMKSQIINLKDQETASLSIHDIHQYSVLYIILGCIIVAGCLYGTMRCRRNKNIRSTTMTDAPSTSVPVAAGTDEDQGAPAPPRARPRFVRLDIPLKV